MQETEIGVKGGVRLADNRTNEDQNEIAGYLQVFHDGAWGGVCLEDFDYKDARVACRQMGFHDEGKLYGQLGVF